MSFIIIVVDKIEDMVEGGWARCKILHQVKFLKRGKVLLNI